MVGSSVYGDGAVRISVAEPGGSSRIFKKDVGDVPVHGFGAIQNKDAATSHGLEVGGALDGAELADAQHRARDGTLQANGVGDEGPDVGVRLQDQGDAFDGGGVGAFAALGEALFDELLRIGEQARCACRFRIRRRSRL